MMTTRASPAISTLRQRSAARPWVAALVVACLGGSALPAAAQGGGGGESAPPAVLVQEVAREDVTPEFRYVGRVEAVADVALRARVPGFLEERLVREGATVEKGDLLLRIEQAPYQAVVAEREAAIASAEAELNLAEVEYRRAERLVERNVQSQETLDLAEAERKTAEAGLEAARAGLKRAELDLSYTEIRSPVSGRIGLFAYDVGDLVGPESEPLAQVTTTNPVYVVLQVREEQVLAERKRGLDLENPRFYPQLELADGTRYELRGEFNFLSPTVNRSTDTVTARAVFDNPDRILVPGQFVTVIVRTQQEVTEITVPQKAVQRDAEGYFALVVNREDRVDFRRIEVERQVRNKWVVTEGLSPGERIIVEGIQKVNAGGRVDPQVAQDTPAIGAEGGSGTVGGGGGGESAAAGSGQDGNTAGN